MERSQPMALAVRPLRQADTLASYITNPIGSYVAGSSAAVFWANEALTGILFWGHPDEADAELITLAVRAGALLYARPHTSLVDLRQLEFVNLRAFDRLASGLAPHFRSPGCLVTRQALITPQGPVGTILADLFRSPSEGASIRSFAAAGEALVWVGLDDRTLLDDLERIPRASSLAPSILVSLRTHLDRRPASSVAEIARHFGLSQRTFQRRLRELGTRFQREVNQSHLRVAKGLMRETNHPLKWIALESGYASLQHFSSSFRAHVGVSPSRWRAATTE